MLCKAKETFEFGGPGDPSIAIDLTDGAIGRKATALKQVIASERELFERAAAGEVGDGDGDAEKVAELWRLIITSLAGADAYKKAIAWIGAEPKDCNLILAPLVTWMVGTVGGLLNANVRDAERKYLGEPHAL